MLAGIYAKAPVILPARELDQRWYGSRITSTFFFVFFFAKPSPVPDISLCYSKKRRAMANENVDIFTLGRITSTSFFRFRTNKYGFHPSLSRKSNTFVPGSVWWTCSSYECDGMFWLRTDTWSTCRARSWTPRAVNSRIIFERSAIDPRNPVPCILGKIRNTRIVGEMPLPALLQRFTRGNCRHLVIECTFLKKASGKNDVQDISFTKGNDIHF